MTGAQINDRCVNCAACAQHCPSGSITEGTRHFVIDRDTCVDCLACAAVCPVDAIEHPGAHRTRDDRGPAKRPR